MTFSVSASVGALWVCGLALTCRKIDNRQLPGRPNNCEVRLTPTPTATHKHTTICRMAGKFFGKILSPYIGIRNASTHTHTHVRVGMCDNRRPTPRIRAGRMANDSGCHIRKGCRIKNSKSSDSLSDVQTHTHTPIHMAHPHSSRWLSGI